MKITIGALQNLNFEANLEYISPKAVENNGANQFEVKAAIRSTKGGKSVLATAPMPRLYWQRLPMYSPFRRVPSSLAAILPLYIS